MPRVRLALVSASPAVRRTGRSAFGRYSWLTLAVTLVLAAALLTGDIWLTRAGAVVAFLGGITACLLAWREVRQQRIDFEQRSTAELRSRATTARAEVGRLNQELARLRGDNAGLRLELARLNELNNAEVLALPRRVAGAVSSREIVLWSEENLPTVVDLKAITAPVEIEDRRRQA